MIKNERQYSATKKQEGAPQGALVSLRDRPEPTIPTTRYLGQI